MSRPETRIGPSSPPVSRLSVRLALLLAATLGGLLANSAVMSKPILKPVSFSAIPGWTGDDLSDAFSAFHRSCSEVLDRGRAFARPVLLGGERTDWMEICTRAAGLGPQLPESRARQFFESNFRPFIVQDGARSTGLFTGYFEPEAQGDRERRGEFAVPLYAKPPDLLAFDAKTEAGLGVRYGRLVDGKPQPYFTRRQIEEGALSGRGLEIAWLKSWADAFFIHVQGSGRIRLRDGTIMRLAYAAKNGRPYTGIGGILVERGEIERGAMSMQAIRDWMQRNPDRARELMWENSSFVFFRQVVLKDLALGPPGAQQVELTPWRSLAVDRTIWAFGTPLWIETQLPSTHGQGGPPFRRLMIAQDTGSAIKGAIRGDIFFGFGDEAARLAGHMKSEGRVIALLPIGLANKLDGRIGP